VPNYLSRGFSKDGNYFVHIIIHIVKHLFLLFILLNVVQSKPNNYIRNSSLQLVEWNCLIARTSFWITTRM